MSTKMTYSVGSASSEETVRLGKELGRRLKGGEIIELISDVGGGKTHFTKGVALGLGSADHVSSPTFKICNTYKGADGLAIFHYDFYRLAESGLIEHELADVLGDKKSVIVIEWSNLVEHVLPEDRLTINIKSNGESKREIVYNYSSSLAYLVE